MKSRSWLAPFRALAASVRAAFSKPSRSRCNSRNPPRRQRHTAGPGRGAALRRWVQAAPGSSQSSSLVVGLFRIVAVVLFTCVVTGVLGASPPSVPLPVTQASASLAQSLKDFFTRLWSPATSDAELGTAYVHDEEGNLLSETGTGGANSSGTTNYIYLPTANGPMPVAAEINGKLYAVHGDHLNTPRRLTDSQGQAVWQWAYSAFGDEEPTTAKNRFANLSMTPTPGTTGTLETVFNLRWRGQYDDRESGFFYNHFRSYSPTTGRYTQNDPIGLAGGWNRPTYVDGNPLSYVDPTGLKGYMPPVELQGPLVYDTGSSCKLMSSGGTVDENGCISTGGGPSICIGPAAIKGLTAGAERVLGNLWGLADSTVAAAIRARGGSAANIARLETGMGQKTVGEVAEAAAKGDSAAAQAIKMIKQAAQKGQRY